MFQMKKTLKQGVFKVEVIPLVSEKLVIHTVVVAVILLEGFGGWDGMSMN